MRLRQIPTEYSCHFLHEYDVKSARVKNAVGVGVIIVPAAVYYRHVHSLKFSLGNSP